LTARPIVLGDPLLQTFFQLLHGGRVNLLDVLRLQDADMLNDDKPSGCAVTLSGRTHM